MPGFSERMGFTRVREKLQKDSMDNGLRYGLWNTASKYYWATARTQWHWRLDAAEISLPDYIWRTYFKLPLDDLPTDWAGFHRDMKNHFMGCEWHAAYNLIEYLAGIDDAPYTAARLDFINECNVVLEQELSAYRFVGDKLMQLTSEQEIVALESAIATGEASTPLHLVATHLKRALASLADRQAPDFRNSMKESISAVEATCKLIVGDEHATLGAALNRIEAARKLPLHPSIKEAFAQLYKYTSDADGIRHALKDESNVALEDATYMLVTCSAFVNYLVEMSRKAGIAL